VISFAAVDLCLQYLVNEHQGLCIIQSSKQSALNVCVLFPTLVQKGLPATNDVLSGGLPVPECCETQIQSFVSSPFSYSVNIFKLYILGYDPSIYALVSQLVTFLEVFSPKFSVHFLFRPCILHAPPSSL